MFIKCVSKIRIVFILGKFFVLLIRPYFLLPNEALHLGVDLNRFLYEEKIFGDI